MLYFKKISYSVFLILFVFLLNSCSKESSEKINTSENQNLEVADIPEEDVAEKDEDLLTVDYKVFYDELAPHGDWIEVTGNEIGLDLRKESGSGTNNTIKNKKKISLSELFGIKDAYAADMEFGSFFVWRPSANLAISVSSGNAAPVYTPYANGQWIYTPYGWYFKAPTAHEEIIHHYGRWVNSPSMGWIWVPGRVWSPAWVEWREDDVNIAWTPLSPSIYLVAGEIPVVPVYEENYVIVEKRYFVEPVVYNYFYTDKEYRKLIRKMSRPKGVVVVNNVIMNQGPGVIAIERVTGTSIPVVKVHKVGNISDIQFTGSDIKVFTPKFRKVKSKENLTYNHFQPRKYTKYDGTSFNPNNDNKKIESSGKNNNSRKNEQINKENVNRKKSIDKRNRNENFKQNEGNRIEKKNKNEFRKKDSDNNNNNKKNREVNKRNSNKERKNNDAVKENRKSRNKEGNSNEKRERKNDGKKKRSYYDDDNSNYDFKAKYGLT